MRALGRRHDLEPRQTVERAGRAGDDARGDAGVDRGGRQPAVAEQDLEDADVGPGLEQMGGEAVPQGVDGDRFRQAGRRTATRQAACSVAVLTGLPWSRPGNSQCAGLAKRQ